MKITLSVIKADIGSIGGHVKPSKAILDEAEKPIKTALRNGKITDYRVTFTGDDIALLMTHYSGVGSSVIHQLAWNAFIRGTGVAKKQGLYGAGQDMLKNSFSGNIKGAGPAIAEMEFEERENEPFMIFAADKTSPGAYNLPFYLAFGDPMNTPGLLLSSRMGQGYKFVILDVSETSHDRFIELNTPEDAYEIAALLRDNDRFCIEAIYSRASGDIAMVQSTTRLRNIAGKYVGKDDPVAICRVQKDFPATGEVLAPYAIGHYVPGGMRGSHTCPLMPVKQNTSVSYFDGPPVVSCAVYCVHGGKLTEAADVFDQPFWDEIRSQVARKALEIRRQGFSGAAMLPYDELEYGGIKEVMEKIDGKFKKREEK
ncbi:MAG: fructose-1,6-bisphosphate aldolase/phosphatase [Candidatus Gracilibacteria bacterium]|jgi:fructose 1,6-bisphosphate aldolase/phosphatase